MNAADFDWLSLRGGAADWAPWAECTGALLLGGSVLTLAGAAAAGCLGRARQRQAVWRLTLVALAGLLVLELSGAAGLLAQGVRSLATRSRMAISAGPSLALPVSAPAPRPAVPWWPAAVWSGGTALL